MIPNSYFAHPKQNGDYTPKSSQGYSPTKKQQARERFSFWIGGVSSSATTNELHDFFNQRGYPVSSIDLKISKDGTRGMGFGYGTAEDEESYNRIIQQKFFFYSGYRWVDCRPFLRGSALRKFQSEFRRRKLEVINISQTILELSDLELELYKRLQTFEDIQSLYLVENSQEESPAGVVVFKQQNNLTSFCNSVQFLKLTNSKGIECFTLQSEDVIYKIKGKRKSKKKKSKKKYEHKQPFPLSAASKMSSNWGLNENFKHPYLENINSAFKEPPTRAIYYKDTPKYGHQGTNLKLRGRKQSGETERFKQSLEL